MSPKKQEYVQRVRAYNRKKKQYKARDRLKKSTWLGDLCGVTKDEYKKESEDVDVREHHHDIYVLDGYLLTKVTRQLTCI